MDELTKELDARTAALEDATELLEFLLDQWKNLRNQLQKAAIGPDDNERLECEAAVASAKQAHEVADVPRCLDALGDVGEWKNYDVEFDYSRNLRLQVHG